MSSNITKIFMRKKKGYAASSCHGFKTANETDHQNLMLYPGNFSSSLFFFFFKPNLLLNGLFASLELQKNSTKTISFYNQRLGVHAISVLKIKPIAGSRSIGTNGKMSTQLFRLWYITGLMIAQAQIPNWMAGTMLSHMINI